MISGRDIIFVLTSMFIIRMMYASDGHNVHGYTIQDRNDTVSLNNLKKLSGITIQLYDIFKNNPKYANHEGLERLMNRFTCPDGVCRIEEQRAKYKNYAAYSIDKGKVIGVCMKHKGEYVDDNTMIFVYLHELAHIMTNNYAHDDEFWNNFAFLLEIAVSHRIYTYEPFHVKSVDFCGETINFTPYVQK